MSLDVAIVNAVALLPGVKSVQDSWHAVMEDKEYVRRLPEKRLDLDALLESPDLRKKGLLPNHVQAGIVVAPEFEKFCLDNSQWSRATQMSMFCCDTLLRDQKLPPNTAVILGNILLPTLESSAWAEEAIKEYNFSDGKKEECSPKESRYWDRGQQPAQQISVKHEFKADVYCIDAACASSLYAILEAARLVSEGICESAITGGVCAPDLLFCQMGFHHLLALSKSGHARPFDKCNDGLVVGEGCGLFLLKPLKKAQKNNDQILGVIKGGGLSNDLGKSLLNPSSAGQLKSLAQVYAMHDLYPGDIDYVECHATGTKAGDQVELQTIQEYFSGSIYNSGNKIQIGSAKGQFGHLLTAAGALGVFRALAAFKSGKLPPNVNCLDPLPSKDTVAVLSRESDAAAFDFPLRNNRDRNIAVNAFGFGGINAHLVLGDFAINKKWDSGQINTQLSEKLTIKRSGEEKLIGRDDTLYLYSAMKLTDLSDINIDSFSLAIPPSELRGMLASQSQLFWIADKLFHPAFEGKTGIIVDTLLDMNASQFFPFWKSYMRLQHLPVLNAEKTLGSLGAIAASRIARIFKTSSPSFTIMASEAIRAVKGDAIGENNLWNICQGQLNLPEVEQLFIGRAHINKLGLNRFDQDELLAGFIVSKTPQIRFEGRAYQALCSLDRTSFAAGMNTIWDVALEHFSSAEKKKDIHSFESGVAKAISCLPLAHGHVSEFKKGSDVNSYIDVSVEPEFKKLGNKGKNNPEYSAYHQGRDKLAAYPYSKCAQFAVGEVRDVLGEKFNSVDNFEVRIKLPDEPLLLCHRIMEVKGDLLSMKQGSLITEHDILSGSWYLDRGKIPLSIAVEAGQADLFMSAFLGMDHKIKGTRRYRLLNAKVTMYGDLPGPGKTIQYRICINRFFDHSVIPFFEFEFDAYVYDFYDDKVEPYKLMTMREGVAGFFTKQELLAGKGIKMAPLKPVPAGGKVDAIGNYWISDKRGSNSLEEPQLNLIRRGLVREAFEWDRNKCLQAVSANKSLQPNTVMAFPDGFLNLVDRVEKIDLTGGRFNKGVIKATARVEKDSWFLTCHFQNDEVMPGTLMFECCSHTLRIFLMRIGWQTDKDTLHFSPLPGLTAKLNCRGQVLANTNKITYEIHIKELGSKPNPYAVADAIMYADDKCIVEINDMSVRYNGVQFDDMKNYMASTSSETFPNSISNYNYETILHFAAGYPSKAFGERYLPFDRERKIARLPRPPYLFMDGVTEVSGKAWEMEEGTSCLGHYLIKGNEWYFHANNSSGSAEIPFAILLEIALQPCGWLAGYMGSALTSETDLSFRNLGGEAKVLQSVLDEPSLLKVRATFTSGSRSMGMIIQNYDFKVTQCKSGIDDRTIYEGTTVFGFFDKKSLAQQVGLRELPKYCRYLHSPTNADIPYPVSPTLPNTRFRFIDKIDFIAGHPDIDDAEIIIRGTMKVNPLAWFFKAHFYQDPVIPGSIGIESFLQLLKYAGYSRWGKNSFMRFSLNMPEKSHNWIYRGQIIPSNKNITVLACIRKFDDENKVVVADGILACDGKPIYEMKSFFLTCYE